LDAGVPAPLSGESPLRRFGPSGLLAILVVLGTQLVLPPLSALLVLGWARLSRTPWAAIGFSRPRSWIAVIAGGTVLGVAFKLVMKALVMPLLGAPPINPAYHFLAGDAAASARMALVVIVTGGFAEEIIFRGFLFERLGALWGRSPRARVATVLLTSIYFGLLHYPEQGLAGAEQAFVTGAVIGTVYAVTRNLWLPIVVHAVFDLTAIAIIYWNLESTVAHWVFP
jgi:CAAX protease family protein